MLGRDIIDPRAVAFDAGFGALAGGGLQAINIARQLPAINAGLNSTSAVRNSLAAAGSAVGVGRNVAVAEAAINGNTSIISAVSGYVSRQGTVALPGETIFSASSIRALDSERKILENIAAGLDMNSTGSIKLFTERPPCASCQGVVSQFEVLFPNISVDVTSGVPTSSFILSFLGGMLGGSAANGGFLIYPNKLNTNATTSVYSK